MIVAITQHKKSLNYLAGKFHCTALMLCLGRRRKQHSVFRNVDSVLNFTEQEMK